jgi:hypothetical protein
MALEAAFQELWGRLQHLEECLAFVQVTVVEDTPARGDTVLVDQFSNATLDIRGLLAEAIAAAVEATQAVGHPLDVDRARRALAKCQERFHRVARRFAADLVSYERIADLTSLGLERRGGWRDWSHGVKVAIEACRRPLDEAADALFQCWQEIGERVGMTSVSVRTTNVGQQFSGAAAGELAREGIP